MNDGNNHCKIRAPRLSSQGQNSGGGHGTAVGRSQSSCDCVLLSWASLAYDLHQLCLAVDCILASLRAILASDLPSISFINRDRSRSPDGLPVAVLGQHRTSFSSRSSRHKNRRAFARPFLWRRTWDSNSEQEGSTR